MCARMKPPGRLLLWVLGAVDYYTPGSGRGPKGSGARLAPCGCRASDAAPVGGVAPGSAVPVRHLAPLLGDKRTRRATRCCCSSRSTTPFWDDLVMHKHAGIKQPVDKRPAASCHGNLRTRASSSPK